MYVQYSVLQRYRPNSAQTLEPLSTAAKFNTRPTSDSLFFAVFSLLALGLRAREVK